MSLFAAAWMLVLEHRQKPCGRRSGMLKGVSPSAPFGAIRQGCRRNGHCIFGKALLYTGSGKVAAEEGEGLCRFAAVVQINLVDHVQDL
jgi:hypothetical protein